MPPKRKRTQEQTEDLERSGIDLFKKYRRTQIKRGGDTSRWSVHEDRLNNEWRGLSEDARIATETRLKDGIEANRRLSDMSDMPVETGDVEDTPVESDVEIFKQHRRARIQGAGDLRPEHVHEARLTAQWDNLSERAQNTEVQRIRIHLTAGTAIEDISDAEGAEPPQFRNGEIQRVEGEELIVDSSEEDEVEVENPRNDVVIMSHETPAQISSALSNRAQADPPNYKGQNWQLATHLGEGSSGLATLWILKDGKGNIVDRIAVKDQHYRQNEWSSINLWYGDPRNFGTRTLMEAKAMSNLNEKAGSGAVSQSIIKLLASRVEMKKMASRIIMSYCGHGDLDGIITKYGAAGVPIPEAFVWAVFYALADACLLMKYGNRSSEGDEKWQQIVHQDINPKNVFFDVAASDTTESRLRPFPGYQQPVLADFGHSIITSPYDDLNPLAYAAGRGTEYFRAPEQLGWLRTNTLYPEPIADAKLLSPTNIYQVGVTIAAMMRRETVDQFDGPTWETWGPGDWEVFPEQTREEYSKELCKLVKRCVFWDPAKRISAARLEKKILKNTGGRPGVVDQAAGMREEWTAAVLEEDSELARRTVMRPQFLKQDQYKIVLAAPAPAQ